MWYNSVVIKIPHGQRRDIMLARRILGVLCIPVALFTLISGLSFVSADKQRELEAKIEAETQEDFEPMPETLFCTVEGLADGAKYTVEVVPLNVWLGEGEGITAEVR